MKKRFVMGAVAGVVSLVGAKLLKHHRGHGGHGCCNKKKMIIKFLDWKLRLTKSQKEKIEVIVDQIMEAHEAQRESKKAVMNQFSELFLLDRFESEIVQKQILETMVTPCVVGAGSVLEQIHGILSPEQRREAVRLLEKHHGCCGRKGTC